MATNPKIIWEKWVNPLTGAGGDETPADDGDDYLAQEAQAYGGLQTDALYRPKLGQCIAGPMGIIPITEHGDPAVVYDFWMMHTNFPISARVVSVLRRVQGIEGLNVYSPYRARVAFGKAFVRAEVINAVQQALGVTPAKPALALAAPLYSRLTQLARFLGQRHPAWAIFVRGDGRFDFTYGDEATVRGRVAAQQEGSCRRVLTSWGEGSQ